MDNRNEIRQLIKTNARRGDWVEVAVRVGLKPNTVHKVVRGQRENDKVLMAFTALFAERAAAKEQFQSPSAVQ